MPSVTGSRFDLETSRSPVQASIAGFARCVDAAGEKLKGLPVPLTLYLRYETLLYMLHCVGFAWHQAYSCGVMYCASA